MKVKNHFGEKIIHQFLFLCGSISILTTLGIIYVLFSEGINFFSQISIIEFFTDTAWRPFGNPENDAFRIGIAPLVVGTLLVTVVALSVAVPLGLATAIYLSEYASKRIKRKVKPVLEILAGIPTVVLGYFALTLVTPLIRNIFPGDTIDIFNALSAGLVVGIMIIPTVASISEDSLSAVPQSLRNASYSLGLPKSSTVLRVVFPAALSGIISSILLAMGRAIGETMIVAIAAGNLPSMTINPGSQVQTMTGYIVQAVGGEASRGSLTYNSIFAVGIILFLMTFILNIIANYFTKRFREVYE